MHKALSCLLVLFGVCHSVFGAPRTSIPSDGKYTVEAEFGRLADEQFVVLIKTDGKTINVHIDKLSAPDRALVRKLAAEAEAKKPPRQPIKDDDTHKLKSGEAAVWTALEADVAINFDETPLDEVLDYIEQQIRVPIYTDWNALADVGIGIDCPTTFQAKTIKAREGLEKMLMPLGLTWLNHHDVLFITSQEGAEEQLPLMVLQRQRSLERDALIEAIVRRVEPDSWDEVGGPGQIKAIPNRGLIAVKQTQYGIDQIERLLALVHQAHQ